MLCSRCDSKEDAFTTRFCHFLSSLSLNIKYFLIVYIYPFHMSNFFGFRSRKITFLNYGIEKLIVMQKLEPKTAGLRSKKIGHVDWMN